VEIPQVAELDAASFWLRGHTVTVCVRVLGWPNTLASSYVLSTETCAGEFAALSFLHKPTRGKTTYLHEADCKDQSAVQTSVSHLQILIASIID